MDGADYPKLIAAGKLHYKIKCSHSDRCKRGLVKTPNLFA
jgi:hypothetical protein